MVTIEQIQAAYYMVAATGVLVAAVFYIINLRMSQKALRINMTNNILQFISSVEGQKVWGELLNMEWKDYEDFEKKYGSDNNLDNFAKRQAVFNMFNTAGKQLEAGHLDIETLYEVTSSSAPWTWAKFRSVIVERRRRYTGSDSLKGFEYLAGEMTKLKLEKDPNYKIPESFARYLSDK